VRPSGQRAESNRVDTTLKKKVENWGRKLGTDGKFSIFGRAQVRAVGPPFDAARISGDGDRDTEFTVGPTLAAEHKRKRVSVLGASKE
jgi:hypothetical protein